jgi:hypothetical protein
LEANPDGILEGHMRNLLGKATFFVTVDARPKREETDRHGG